MARRPIRHVAADADAGRLDRLVQRLTGLPRAGAQRLIHHGAATVNGAVCVQDFHRVAPGDAVAVAFDPHNVPRTDPDHLRRWRDPAFHILHEDEHLIVVDKAAHILTVPTGEHQPAGKTLESRVTAYLQKTHRGREAIVVHRLDQGTSGVLVLAKTAAAARQLRAQFESRKPQRVYHALVAGLVAVDQGTFRSRLITAPNLDQVATADPRKGQLAITHYRVVHRYRDYTHVECRLETGRRNQIRVHFADADHPVLGDRRYQPALARHPRWPHKRLALHAATLGFVHPVTNQPLQFEAPLPREFAKLVSTAP
jgi:23S rRNA pseudouridine1911/1915/1917 synthase